MLELRRDYAEKYPKLLGSLHPHQFFLTTEEMHALLSDPLKLGSDSIGEKREVIDKEESIMSHVVHANVDVETVISKQDMLGFFWSEPHIRWLLSQVGVPDDAMDGDDFAARPSVRRSHMHRKSSLALTQRDAMYQRKSISARPSASLSGSTDALSSEQPAGAHDSQLAARRGLHSDTTPLPGVPADIGILGGKGAFQPPDRLAPIVPKMHSPTILEMDAAPADSFGSQCSEESAIAQLRTMKEIGMLRDDSHAMQDRLGETEKLNRKLAEVIEGMRKQMEQMHAAVVSDPSRLPTAAE